MRIRPHLLIVFIAGLLEAERLPAQEYLDLWRNSKTDNFYLIQKKFNEYYAAQEKDCGHEDDEYTKFKRWEYFIEPRVYPSGKLINHAKLALDEELRYRNQTKSLNAAHNGNWQSLGIEYYTDKKNLGNGMGRVNCIAPHPTDPQTLFAGTPSGGLWKTTNGGKNWTSLTDGLPVIGISGIAVNPRHPDSIYILTGDGDGDDTNSTGVLLSVNGGDTWQSTGLQFDVFDYVRGYKLLIHPSDPQILYAATTEGLYKTTNGGVNWGNPVLKGSFSDIAFNPDFPSVIYAVTDKICFVSFDAGENWKISFEIWDNERMAIGVSSANSNYVYVIAGSSMGFAGLYRSEDGGQNFTLRSYSPNILGWDIQPPFDQESQSFYDLAIAVSPTNADEVFIGGINCWKSLDGGSSWFYTSYWRPGDVPPGQFVHADIHSLVFNGTTLYCGNDGGICYSDNNADSWTDISVGLEITQFYRIGLPATTLDIVYGGAQDNGINKWTLPNTTMERQFDGDGMECVVDYTDENIVYAFIQEGKLLYVTENGGACWAKKSPPAEGAWVTPLIMHPTDHTKLYAGYRAVYEITNTGEDFKPISPDFDSRDNCLISLAMSAASKYYMYGALPNSMKLCPDITASDPTLLWKDITGSLPVNAAQITDVTVSATEANKAWVCFSGYSEGRKVYQTSNSGKTWTNISGSLPNEPVNCIIYHNNGNDGIYIGTDIGVFYRDNTLTDWIPFRNGMPNVMVYDLKIAYNIIRAATFGRGIWESDLYGNCRPSYKLSGDVTGFQFYEASDAITSTANIKGGDGTDVKYKAANQITLNPGFKVAPESKFTATIDKCTGTKAHQRKYRGIYEGVMPGVVKKKAH